MIYWPWWWWHTIHEVNVIMKYYVLTAIFQSPFLIEQYFKMFKIKDIDINTNQYNEKWLKIFQRVLIHGVLQKTIIFHFEWLQSLFESVITILSSPLSVTMKSHTWIKTKVNNICMANKWSANTKQKTYSNFSINYGIYYFEYELKIGQIHCSTS